MQRFRIFAAAAALAFFLIWAGGCPSLASVEASVSTAPADYSNADNWLALPRHQKSPADVIYFYPTAYMRKNPDTEPVICAVDHAGMRASAAEVFKKQATVFDTVADIFAPYYSQADGMYALTRSTAEKDALLSGAPLTDAEAALDYYFEHYNKGRPYILAAHSQGTNVLVLLLADYMKKHPDRYRRMVAAYAIGYSVTEDYLAENPHLKFAQGPNDTGVIISYNTEAPIISGRDPVWLKGSVAINPINWSRGGTEASSADNLGSLTKVFADGTLSVDKPGIANAHLNLKRGTVVCSSVEKASYEMPVSMASVFGRGLYHAWDYGFYYMNLRQNARDRVKAFLSRGK